MVISLRKSREASVKSTAHDKSSASQKSELASHFARSCHTFLCPLLQAVQRSCPCAFSLCRRAVAPDIDFIIARLVLFSAINLYDCFSQKGR